MRDINAPSASLSPSPSSSIKRSGSPGPSRLVRPSTLRATYSQASLRSVAAPTLAHAQAQDLGAEASSSSTSTATVGNMNPGTSGSTPSVSISHHRQSSSLSLAYASGVLLSEPQESDAASPMPETGIGGPGGMFMLGGTGTGAHSEAASTAVSSATSTTGDDTESESGTNTRTRIEPSGGANSGVVAAETLPVDADGVVDTMPGQAKLALRDHLRRTLSESSDHYPSTSTPRDRPSNLQPVHELHHHPNDDFPERHYFILTNAGKPVFISREASDRDNSDLTSAMGLMQALISVFADDGDKIRCINAGRTRISFLLRAPLYYACVSSWREPESVTRIHLDYLHQHILSVVTAAQLRKIFERRTNFDLRRLLEGTEGFLFSLIARLEEDFGLTTSSLNAVRLDPVLRTQAGTLLVPPKDYKEVLYTMLLSRSPSPRVITLSRPKKQSIHPSDLHILLNTLSSKSLSANSTASSSAWLPICLPKYNAEGFLHVYVSFMSGEDPEAVQQQPSSAQEGEGGNTDEEEGRTEHTTAKGAPSGNEICLVIVTPRREDFEKMHNWAGAIEEKLRSTNMLRSLITSCRRSDYSVTELAIPGLRHFLYKSRSHVQITMPRWDDPYDEPTDRKRLITLYQTVHDALHARSGQLEGPLKLQCVRTDREMVMGWVTQPFELLLTISPHMPKTAAVSAANAIAKWVKKEEGRLFIRDSPVF